MYALAWVIFLNQQEELKWEISLVLEPTKHFWTVNTVGHCNKSLLELKKHQYFSYFKAAPFKMFCFSPCSGFVQSFFVCWHLPRKGDLPRRQGWRRRQCPGSYRLLAVFSLPILLLSDQCFEKKTNLIIWPCRDTTFFAVLDCFLGEPGEGGEQGDGCLPYRCLAQNVHPCHHLGEAQVL